MNWQLWLWLLVLACIAIALSPLFWDWGDEPGQASAEEAEQAALRNEIDQAMAWVEDYMRKRRMSNEEESA